MAYTKTNWQNDQAPAINASNLNKIEQGIFDNDAGITNLLQEIGINTTTWVSTNTYSLNDVVVYNKKLYKNITGSHTTTNPSDDTTNWNEIQIINSNGKLNKSLIPYFNNSASNATDEGYNCRYINDSIELGLSTELNISLSSGSISSGNLYLSKSGNGNIAQISGSLTIARDGNDRCIISASSSLRPSSEITINASVLRYATNSRNVGMFALKIATNGTISVDMYDGATNQNVEVYFQPFTIYLK